MKIVSIVVLCILMTSNLYSQDEDVLRPRGVRNDQSRANSSSSSSKTPLILGIEAGLNYNMFSQTITGLVPNSRFAVFESASGISPLVGVFLDVAIADNLGIQFKVAYDQKYIKNTKDAIIDCQIFGVTGSIVDAQISGEFTNTVSYIDLTPLLRWNITPELFLLVGPTVHLQIGNGSGTFTETITSSGDCYFNFGTPDSSKTSTLTFDSLGTVSPRIGAQIDLGYKIAVSPTISLVPKVGYQYMFTKLASDEVGTDNSRQLSTGLVSPFTATNKILNSLQFTLGLWFQL